MTFHSEAVIKRATKAAEIPWLALCKDVDSRIPLLSPEPKLGTISRMAGNAAVAAYVCASVAVGAAALDIARAVGDASGSTVVSPLGDGLIATELIVGASQLKKEAAELLALRANKIRVPSVSSVSYTYESFQNSPAVEAA
ncbi:MAG TPA: hypothetical protein VHD60_02855 [Candidatus Saccharimonadales bacterium]|nr:hypothetical protein [Candidatus Saccharimonadales bacterium]